MVQGVEEKLIKVCCSKNIHNTEDFVVGMESIVDGLLKYCNRRVGRQAKVLRERGDDRPSSGYERLCSDTNCVQ